MRRSGLSLVSILAAALLAATGCSKKDSGKKPAKSGGDPPAMSATMGAGAMTTPGPKKPGVVKKFDHGAWNKLLMKYVNAKGQVNYAAWQKSAADVKALDAYLQSLARAMPASLGQKGGTAFWLNAYNAFVVRGILNKLPTMPKFSVSQKVAGKPFGFFDEAAYPVAGKKISLNELENGLLRGDWGHHSLKKTPQARLAVLRKQHEVVCTGHGPNTKVHVDPRVHFGLVCASVGCPNLRAEAFTSDQLGKQLDASTRAYVNDQTKGASTTGVSSIFHWFKKDFTAGGKSVKGFIKKYYKGDASSLAYAKQIKYSWKLNAQ